MGYPSPDGMSAIEPHYLREHPQHGSSLKIEHALCLIQLKNGNKKRA